MDILLLGAPLAPRLRLAGLSGGGRYALLTISVKPWRGD
jgi:hypothetical protein